MAVDPNDLDSIFQSNQDAIPKDRIKKPERLPSAANNNMGKYPLRRVEEYPGGHRITVDSTPGARVTETVHGSGTMTQVSEDGTKTETVVGAEHHYVKGGYSLSIDQNGDIKISGHARISITGGAHIEVMGNLDAAVGGTLTAHVGGVATIAASGDMNLITGGNMNMTASGDVNQNARGNMNHQAAGTYTMTSGGSSTMTSGGDMSKNSPAHHINSGTLDHNGVNVGDTHVHGGISVGGDDTQVPH